MFHVKHRANAESERGSRFHVKQWIILEVSDGFHCLSGSFNGYVGVTDPIGRMFRSAFGLHVIW
jgi:hypothetical protein